jgi:hypothetical protein
MFALIGSPHPERSGRHDRAYKLIKTNFGACAGVSFAVIMFPLKMELYLYNYASPELQLYSILLGRLVILFIYG